MLRRRPQASFAIVAFVATGVLAFFALSLANSQSDARTDLEERFAERAEVTAALTEALFGATTGTQAEENAKLYGTPRVSTATMDEQLAQGTNAYLVVVESDGGVVAKSSATPPEVLAAIERDSEGIAAAAEGLPEGAPYWLSDLIDLPDGAGAVNFAVSVPAQTGQRALVSGVSAEVLAVFLGGYLGEVPTIEGGSAYVIDSTDAVIASQREDVASGSVVDEPGLTEALDGGGASGAFGPGDDSYFAASPVADSDWTVVSTAPQAALFETVEGADKWIPWLLFAAFGAALVAVLALVRRALQRSAELAATNATLATAQERLEVANAALERRATELARSNAELDQFASIASHDLQEPLRKVQAFSSQVVESEKDLSERGREYLGRTSDAAERMQALIQDLLRFSRVATHTRPFVKTDLNEVAAEVLDDLETTISEAGATVEVGDLPTVPVDPMQIRQLLQNLVSNALKFRREGIEHRVELSGSAGPRFAEIVVSDNGIGFEPEYADRIFRVFERLHGRGAYPGTGIGLALCRKIAERHGGTVGAAGVPGEGARFIVRLPVEHEHEPEPETEATPDPDAQEPADR